MEKQEGQKERSLAWFKLAELIARGEREKALNVFRLLSHSFSDRAYALQLEGDILWYSDDKGSIEKYKQAAFLYQKEKRWVDAIAIYEHLLSLSPNSYEIISTLLMFYGVIDWSERFCQYFDKLKGLLDKGDISELQFEQAVRSVVDGVSQWVGYRDKPWLVSWFNDMLKRMPKDLASRLRGLL